MSRIGRMPIAIPAGVTVTIAENNKVTVKGPKLSLIHILYDILKYNTVVATKAAVANIEEVYA